MLSRDFRPIISIFFVLITSVIIANPIFIYHIAHESPTNKEIALGNLDYFEEKNTIGKCKSLRTSDILIPDTRRSRGAWSISEKWNNNTILNNTIHDIGTGDLNGDGFADLAVVGENHTIATYHNNQSYGFTKHFVDIDNNKNYTRVALGDMDNDNDLDMMVLTWPNPVQDPTQLDLYLYENNGGGNFNGGGGVHKVDIGGGGTTFGFIVSLDLTSGDFNNDGNADFVVNFAHYPAGHSTNPSQLTLFFYKNDGAGGFTSNATNVNASDADNGCLWSNVVIKEATGDNFDDVVVSIYGYNSQQAYYPGEARVYNGGAGGLDMTIFWNYSFDQNDEWVFSVDVGEFTGDANPDLLISTDADIGGGGWDDGKIWLAVGQGAQGYVNPADKLTVQNQGAGQSLNVDNFDELDRDDYAVYYGWDTNADDIIDKWEIRIYTTNNQGAFQQKWTDHTGQGGNLQGTVRVIWADDFDNSGAGDVLYVGKDMRLMDVCTGFEPDFTPPAAITDLTVSQPGGMAEDSVKLEWTAPGDDGDSGGPAAYYVVRYNDEPIHDWNFNSSINCTNAPVPGEPGNVESVIIPFLESDTTYYWAIRTVDDAGNWALLSNVVSKQIVDYEEPGSISDLAASYVQENRAIRLTWTAPGDDGGEGTAESYRVGFSDYYITDIFLATPITLNLLEPQSAGSSESMLVDIDGTPGINFDKTYYFAVIAEDDFNNLGDLSNVAYLTLPDITPPSSVILNASSGEDDGEILLTWIAQGDDGNHGCAASYDIRYSFSLIDEIDFEDAFPVTGLSDPGTAGCEEMVTVTGLVGGTKYYFAMKIYDESMNPSPMSNVVAAVARDGKAPLKTMEVLLIDTPDDNGGSLTLTWNASSAPDFWAYRLFLSTSEITSPDSKYLAEEIYDINRTIYNFTEIHGDELDHGTFYYAGILAVDDAGNEGELGLSPPAGPLDDLPPEIQYYLPRNLSLELAADSTQTFNITAEFHDDTTRNIQWYVDDEDIRGENKPLFLYQIPSTIGEERTIKVELDDGTNMIENTWYVKVMDHGDHNDTGDDDTGDDDDTDDDTENDDMDDDLPYFYTGMDVDDDGMDDGWELHYFGGDAAPYVDTDGDGYNNIIEFGKKSNPLDPDDPGNESGQNVVKDKGNPTWAWCLLLVLGIIFILVVVVTVIVISRNRKAKFTARRIGKGFKEDEGKAVMEKDFSYAEYSQGPIPPRKKTESRKRIVHKTINVNRERSGGKHRETTWNYGDDNEYEPVGNDFNPNDDEEYEDEDHKECGDRYYEEDEEDEENGDEYNERDDDTYYGDGTEDGPTSMPNREFRCALLIERMNTASSLLNALKISGGNFRPLEIKLDECVECISNDLYDEADNIIDEVMKDISDLYSSGVRKGTTKEIKKDLNFYDVLEIDRNASQKEIRVSYKKKILEYHPDKVHSLGRKLRELAEEEAKRINEAYRELKDPASRAKYDRKIGLR